MSSSILQQLTIQGAITLDGPNWTRRPTSDLHPNDFKANILCQRHNSALSSLDAAAGNLFRVAPDYQQRLPAEAAANAEFALFDGETIERWMLKTLWGLSAAKAARTRHDTRITNLSPRLSEYDLAEHIFRGRTWPFEWGLHTSFLTGTAIQSSGALALNPYLDEHDRITAIGLEFGGVGFRIGLAVTTENTPGRTTRIRPAGIALLNEIGSEKIIAFGWPGRYSEPMTLNLAPTNDVRAGWPAMHPSD